MTTSDDLEGLPLDTTNEQPIAEEVANANEAEARAIIERIVPDSAERSQFMAILADCIRTAHASGANKWGVTLYRDRIWLIVGRVVVCGVHRHHVSVTVDRGAIPDLSPFERDGLIEAGYKSLPTSISIKIGLKTPQETITSIMLAHAAIVRQAAAVVKQVNSSTAGANSAGTLAYLRTILQQSLPNPGYVGPLPDVDQSTIEQALRDFDKKKRELTYWANWEVDPTYQYAVFWKDRRYPVKEIVRMATSVERFQSSQARDYLEKRGFHIIALHTAANVWIFQANPEQFNLSIELRNAAIGSQDKWGVSSYRNEIRPGDTVLLWQSGKAAGIYAIGEVINTPYQRNWEPDAETLEHQPYQKAQWWVDYRYTKILKQPLLRSIIKEHALLSRMDIFKNAQGTNFRVSPEEWSELETLMSNTPTPTINIHDLLHQQLTARGLYFTPWQIATFYTALQAKGFVILSGISGTGKTKLAQHFAELLPQPGAATVPIEREDDQIAITLKPYMFKYNRLIIPKQATRFFDPPKPGESKDVELTFDEQSHVCRLTHAQYSDTDYVALMLRGSVVKWFKQNFKPDDTLTLEPEFDAKQDLVGFRLANGTLAHTAPVPSVKGSASKTEPASGAGANWLFIPVRPDWRDSKSLLGYFNPLTGAYVWTDFLRFLVRAAQSYRNGEGLAWFVILDEMNLARVEYYFADFLSVLESGRTADGWSREALRIDYPTTSDGDLPPRELRLPPSLVFIGTVNVDETTHAFSPKVLDRAFTIEFIEADFTSYPPVGSTTAPSLTPQLQADMLQRFSQNGQFQRIAKERITAYIDAHPEVRDHLQALNMLLQPYTMHFGFRVFDEIVSFLAAAEENALFDTLGTSTAAFDAAVLMKVLPKFHGSRNKLEAPLRAVLAWCIDPTNPDVMPLATKLDQCDSASAVVQLLRQQTYLYPHTAARIRRMFWSIYTDGFASFG